MRIGTPIAGWGLVLPALLLGLQQAQAQQQFPTPLLMSVSPPGAKVGTTVEVTLRGNNLEEVESLIFSQPGITATKVPPPPNPDPKKPAPPAPPKFKVVVPANTPLGISDIRAVAKWGISNPRSFVLGDLNEIEEKEPNEDVSQPQKVELNTVINGTISRNIDVDYFSFTGKKGQRVVVHCAAFSIDSRLTPLLQLYSAKDKLLTSNRQYRQRDAVLDGLLPEDGDYLVRVCQFTHVAGNADYFYRLKIALTPWIDAAFPPVIQAGKPTAVTLHGRNLPGGQPSPESMLDGNSLQKTVVQVTPPAAAVNERRLAFRGTVLPRAAGLEGFEHRVKNAAGSSNPALLTWTTLPVILDNGKNNTPETRQEITLPCEVCGHIEKRRDRDRYVFSAKKGEVYVLEGYADRLRSPMDLYFKIRRVDNNQMIGEYDDHPEIPQRFGHFFTYSSDPKARLVIPEDGQYELIVSGRGSSVRAGPRHLYRVSIRKEQPDFDLVLVGNNDGSCVGCTLRQGSSQDLQVVCFRSDGFDGEVQLSVEGLPGGVVCPPQTVGPKQKETVLVFTAAAGAPKWAGTIKVKGTATIAGKPMVREAHAGCLVWPAPNNQPAVSRLARSIGLAVREKMPYSLAPAAAEYQVPVGGQAVVKMRVNRLDPNFKAQVQVQRLTAPVITNGNPIGVPNVNIPGNKTEADIKFNIPGNTMPGVYNLVFRGLATFQFQKDPKAKKQNIRIQTVSAPIKFTVYNKVAEVSVATPEVNVKAGGETPVTVRVKRLYDYKGPFTVQLILPSGFSGVSAANLTIPAGANEGKIVLKSPANSKPASNPGVKVRATAKVGPATLTQEGEFKVTVISNQKQN